MPISFDFPGEIEGYVKEVPMFLTRLHEPDPKQMQVLTKVFRMKGKITDEGDKFSVRSGDSILHQFHASDSMRWQSEIRKPEYGSEVLKITEPEKLRVIADKFLATQKLSDKRAGFSEVIFGRSEISGKGNEKPRVVNTCAYVNYTYSLAGLPLFGPGAKVQVIIGFDGKVTGCYRFWREVKESGIMKKVFSVAEIQNIFRENPAFAQIRSGKVVVEKARLGYLTLPPGDVQGALIPVVELRGFVSTPFIERAGFIRFLVAIEYSEEEIKRYNVFNKHFDGSCNIL